MTGSGRLLEDEPAYMSEPESFGDEEVQLLSDLAGDLASRNRNHYANMQSMRNSWQYWV